MRIAPAMLAVFASVFVLLFVPAAAPNSAAVADARHRGGHHAHCTDWKSTKEPPPTIAVYRVTEGRVDVVDFQTYVKRVASREWSVGQIELLRAGVVAVKQYAWFHVLHWRGGEFEGKCFDVKDTTADQLYASKPLHRIPRAVKRAVEQTWSWRLIRDGELPMTGYRRGKKRTGCANDGGYRLYVRSAKKCAADGWSAEQILTTYYSANLEMDDDAAS